MELLSVAEIVTFGWIQAVQDYFDDVPLCVPRRKLLQLVEETAPQMGCNVYLFNPDGSYQAGDLVALCRGFALFLVVGCMLTSDLKCSG